MVFSAKWRLVSIENGDKYHAAIHTPAEHLAELQMLHEAMKTHPDCYIEDIFVDKPAGKVQRAVYIMGEKKIDSGLVPLNTEFEHKSPDGRTVKAKIVLESDEKMVINEKAADYEATAVITTHGDDLTITQTCSGVKCVEKFKRV